jgi:hypothetical protein
MTAQIHSSEIVGDFEQSSAKISYMQILSFDANMPMYET